MTDKIRWEEMYPDEFLQTMEKHPVCYLAYGLAEPHGAYNALGLDWLKATALVERAATEYGGSVAPPCAWHIAERPIFDWFGEQGVKQPLTSAIPAELFYELVLFQIRAADARGFKVAVLVTGHYGGLETDMRLMCEYYTRKTGSPIRLRAMSDGEIIRYENYYGDHAGICETAQLMALRPEFVDLSKRDSTSPNGPWVGTEFPLPDGRMPTPELGEKIVSSQIATLGQIVKEELSAYQPKPGWQAPNLHETASIYRQFEAITRKYWWCSLSLSEAHQGPPPPFPGWDLLGE